MSEELGITVKKSENFDEWYIQVILKSELTDYSDVSGCMILRPDAYFIWEQIQKFTDEQFKKIGIQNVYFPLFIPEKFLVKEKDHVKGFSPEVAWVTQAGDSKLDERLAIRPTSETIIYPSFSKWIRSWRDLPMRYNLWNNVVRWEFKHAVPLLRTREFLWNEGHTVFANEREALAEEDEILGAYKKTTEELLALPGIIGRKTEKEKFPGAVFTSTIEHLLPDGKAIQGPDFHYDGQNFSKAFDITFLDKEKKKQYAWQNTWAITTREIGVMVAIHGDDKGLVLPPKIAPIQVVIVPIYDSNTMEEVLKEAIKLKDKLKEFRTKLDDREEFSPGFKYNEWELKGVPIRIEIGPKDIKSKQVVLVRRDIGKKDIVKADKVVSEIKSLMEDMHKNIFNKALDFLNNNIHKVKTYDEFKKILKAKGGILQACWCGDRNCEDKVKDETGTKIIDLPSNQEKIFSDCIVCGKKAKYTANFAKSY